MRRKSRTTRRGVVMIDVVMMLAVLGIVIVSVIPSARPGESMKLIAVTTVVASDIEFAQSATLARPSDPTIIRFDEDGARYWLALASDPETPILRPNGVDPYLVEFGHGNYRELWGVSLEVQDLTDGTLEFDGMGRLVQSEDGVLRFGNGVGEIAVVVRATTGSVSVVDGSQVGQGFQQAPEPPPMDVDAGPSPPPAPPPPPPAPPPSGPKGGLFGIGILGL